jgi:hypothetical protein
LALLGFLMLFRYVFFADLCLKLFFFRDHVVKFEVDEHVLVGEMKEFKILLLIHLVLIYVVVALMSDNPSYHLHCCHWLGVNQVKQIFFGELANNATLAANNVLRPLSSFEEFFNTNYSSFFVFNVLFAWVTKLKVFTSNDKNYATILGTSTDQPVSHL